MDNNIVENRPKDLKPILINTYKIRVSRSRITLDFGKYKEDDVEKKVDVVSSITFKPEILMDLVIKLFSAGVEYQDKFKKEVGFPDLKSLENSEANKENENESA